MKKILGVLFLIAAAAAAVAAYMTGGPAWGESFRFDKMIQQGALFALALPVCLVLGILLLRRR